MTHFPDFYSKILLFGEYSLLYGSKALSMPSSRFKGKLCFADISAHREENKQSSKALQAFAIAMEKLFKKHQFGFHLNTNELLKDISRGLFFESNIPQGYGLGSSGAVVAAVTDAYGEGLKNRNENYTASEIGALKNDFSRMESYFHGKSSGLDPLISFLNRPILVENSESLRAIDISSNPNGTAGIFMIDSGSPGETQPLVEFFNKQCEDKDYFEKINSALIPINNKCIQTFFEGDVTALHNEMQRLSEFIYSYLQPMVPDSVVSVWEKGLETGNYSLKLCGSGGGGMILGFAPDIEKAKSVISEFDIEVIHTL